MNRLSNDDSLSAIEQAHYQNLQGVYFSRQMKIKGAVLLTSKIIDDNYGVYWNFAVQINVVHREQKQIVSQIVNFYRSKNLRPSIYLTNFPKPANLPAYLNTLGFKVIFKDSWMSYQQKKGIPKTNKDFTITEVQSLKDKRFFIKVFYESFKIQSTNHSDRQLPKTFGKILMSAFKMPARNKRSVNYLVSIDKKPVAIGTLISSNKFAGIYNLGTIPECRNRGIGSAICLRAISDAVKMKNSVIYLTTKYRSYAEELYNKLGFIRKFTGSTYALDE